MMIKINTYITNSVCTMRFFNNLHQIRSKPKYSKTK